MKMLPLFFDLRDRPVLLIGGGRVAWRKASAFAEAGAKLTIIAPDILDDFKSLFNSSLIYKPADRGDIAPHFTLVVIACSDRHLSEELADECRRQRIFCCRCDSFSEGDFIVPMRLGGDALCLGIYSSGVAEMSKFIRERLSASLSAEVTALAEIMAEVRPLVKEKITQENLRRQFFARFINDATLARIAAEGKEKIRSEVLACL